MNNSANITKIFKEFITDYPLQFLTLFSLLLVEGLAASLSILAVVPLADYLVDPSLKSPSLASQVVINGFSEIDISISFWSLGFLFVLINVVKSIISIAVRYSILIIKYNILGGLTADAISIFFSARWSFFSHLEQGKLLNTMYKELGNIGDTLGHIATLIAQVVQFGVYLVLPIWINATLTLTAIGLAVLFGLPFLALSKISYNWGKLNTKTANEYVGVVTETFSAIRLILGYGRQRQSQKRYMNSYSTHVEATLRSQTLHASINTLFQPAAMLAVIVAMGLSITREEASLPELAAIMWSLLSAMPILSSMLQGKISINNFLPSYEQLNILRKIGAKYKETEGELCFSKIKSCIALEQVCFSYPGRSETLIDINIKIDRGSMTALIGESGSGKSTVIDLVLGLEVPDSGRVVIDNVPLNNWSLNSYRERIGYVPQDPQLFHASIRENLLWAFEDASESKLWRALELSNAANFVKELPQGIDTIVGERGMRLSGGQRQRIALARALVRSPELLVLDEATSALDSESELLIQESIEKIADITTVLVVAHRLSTIAKADKVYVLRRGSVIEEGSYSDLQAKDGGILNLLLSISNDK